MTDEIPYSEFDKRQHPEITKKEINRFIQANLKLDGHPFDEQEIVSGEMMPQNCNPHIAGNFRCLNFIKTIVTNPSLFHLNQTLATNNFDKLLPFFKRTHKNLMFDRFLSNKRENNIYNYPQYNDLGFFRAENKSSQIDHERILELITNAFNNYLATYNRYHEQLNNPRLMERNDWKRIETAAHDLALNLAAIEPFGQASAQVARFIENVCRLNAGLRFKTFEDDAYFNADAQSITRKLK